MRFSCFRVLPGSAEALVRWGRQIKYHLTSYFLGNIPAKKYQNRLMHVEVIASQSSVVFLRHSVVISGVLIESNFNLLDISVNMNQCNNLWFTQDLEKIW